MEEVIKSIRSLKGVFKEGFDIKINNVSVEKEVNLLIGFIEEHFEIRVPVEE